METTNRLSFPNVGAAESPVATIVNAKCLLIIQSEYESEGIRGVLTNRGMKSISSATILAGAIRIAVDDRPDLIIVESENLAIDPIKIVSSIKKGLPCTKIILLVDEPGLNRFVSWSATQPPSNLVGIKPLLHRTLEDCDRMIEIIERLLSGKDSIESDLVDVLLGSTVKISRSLANILTKRELDVLRAASVGMANKTIATQLGVSPAYVGNLFTQIFLKLRLRDDSGLNPRVVACRKYFLEYGADNIA